MNGPRANDKYGGSMSLSDALLDSELIPPTPAQVHAARLCVAAHARDAEDAKTILQALGLAP